MWTPIASLIAAYYLLDASASHCFLPVLTISAKASRIISNNNMPTPPNKGDTSGSGSTKIPLIQLPTWNEENNGSDGGDDDTEIIASQLVHALQSSGFLLVQSPDLNVELQESALHAASQVLIGSRTTQDGDDDDKAAENSTGVEGVIDHPTDPKLYLMLGSVDEIATKCKKKTAKGTGLEDPATVLATYWEALERVKRQVLTCIAVGLKLEPTYFVKLHSKNRSALRLLHYPSPPPTGKKGVDNDDNRTNNTEPGGPTIRCKPHSDYGSITLLLTDGVPGLEALIEDAWTPVPYAKGALVVNIGSLLQDWTNGKLLATLHRVVAVDNSSTDTSDEDNAKVAPPRTSLAFFADPDPEVSATLQDPAGMVPTANMYKSVADYIQWRSGGKGRQRSGLAFSKEEEERAKRARTDL